MIITGLKCFQNDSDQDELGGPINFVFSSTDRKIGVFEPQRKLIYLIDSNGNSMEGFPLQGSFDVLYRQAVG